MSSRSRSTRRSSRVRILSVFRAARVNRPRGRIPTRRGSPPPRRGRTERHRRVERPVARETGLVARRQRPPAPTIPETVPARGRDTNEHGERRPVGGREFDPTERGSTPKMGGDASRPTDRVTAGRVADGDDGHGRAVAAAERRRSSTSEVTALQPHHPHHPHHPPRAATCIFEDHLEGVFEDVGVDLRHARRTRRPSGSGTGDRPAERRRGRERARPARANVSAAHTTVRVEFEEAKRASNASGREAREDDDEGLFGETDSEIRWGNRGIRPRRSPKTPRRRGRRPRAE